MVVVNENERKVYCYVRSLFPPFLPVELRDRVGRRFPEEKPREMVKTG